MGSNPAAPTNFLNDLIKNIISGFSQMGHLLGHFISTKQLVAHSVAAMACAGNVIAIFLLCEGEKWCA